MGMHTELVISTQIKPVPEVIEVLKYMVGEIDTIPAKLPDHEFFDCARWTMIFTSHSYYFVPHSVQLLKYDDIANAWSLVTRADFKNYDREIEKFIDWILPYVDNEDEMIGYSRYEESREPTIYYSRSYG